MKGTTYSDTRLPERANTDKPAILDTKALQPCPNWPKNTVYWPGIDADIEDFVNRCQACLETKPNNKQEPMMPHTVPDGPWQKIGMDYFDF